MELRSRLAVRERASFWLAAAAIVLMAVGAGSLMWPRVAGQRTAKDARVIASGNVVPAQPVPSAAAPKEVVRFVEHFCPLTSGGVMDSTQVVPSPTRGWSRLVDPVHCFTIDFPGTWRMEDGAGSTYFWSPETDGPQKNGIYWNADVFVLKPYQTADDERAEYQAMILKTGVRVRGTGELVGAWEKGLNGDGSPTVDVFQERKVFSGRGEFTIHLRHDPKDGAGRAVVEKIADSLKAQ